MNLLEEIELAQRMAEFNHHLDRFTAATRGIGITFDQAAETFRTAAAAMKRRRTGHRHRGTRAWARRYEHRRSMLVNADGTRSIFDDVDR